MAYKNWNRRSNRVAPPKRKTIEYVLCEGPIQEGPFLDVESGNYNEKEYTDCVKILRHSETNTLYVDIACWNGWRRFPILSYEVVWR